MAINLGTSPYYDDFDVEKNFHRVLFKPGYAVQARELTQLQTILQNQIQRFGDHVFKDGSVVVGCAETFQFNVPFVKVKNTDSAGITIGSSAYELYKTTLVNAVVSNELGVSAKIVRVDEDSTGQRVLYLNYQSSFYDETAQELITVFAEDEALTVVDSTGITQSFRFSVSSSSATGVGSLYTIDDGIVYVDGTFVRHNSQTKVLSFYSSTPTKNIGFRIITSTVTSNDDVSLLDPAAGSYNYAAPGGDRYKLTTQLESYEITTTPDQGFHLLFLVEEGKVKRAFNKPQYSELQRVLAQRTYDESGNYVVTGLNVNVREHLKTSTNNGKYTVETIGDASKLVYGVEPGKAYVEGFDTELKSTDYLAVDKATDTLLVDEQQIPTLFGNYVYVKSVTGSWSLAENNATLNLRDGSSVLIATAKFRLLRFYRDVTGTGSSKFYKLYLYGITLEAGKTVDDLTTIRNITTTNSSATVAITPGDDLGSVTQTGFKLHEGTYNSLLFPTGSQAVVQYENDTDYFFWKYLGEYTFNGSGNGSIAVSGVGQTLAGTSSSFKDDFIVVEPVGASYNLAEITGYTPTNTTSGTLAVAVGDAGANRKVYARVRQGNGAPIDLTLDTTFLAVDGSTLTSTSATNLAAGRIYLGVSHALQLVSVHIADDTEAYPSTESGLSAWSNVTSEFTLYENSNDNVYNTSYVQYTGAEDLTEKKIVLKLKNFTRSSTLGYLNRNSYQSALIDFDPTTLDYNKQIFTYELPVYTSESTGITYDIRDVIDFRPTVELRSGYSGQTYVDAKNNNMNASHNVPITTLDTTNGITIPDPDSTLTASFTINLPRKDKVVLTRDGEFKVITGVSALNPQTPADAINAMTLAVIELAPYPSLSTFASRVYDREDYASIVRLVDNRRYTMRDIGELEQRVNRLEYYTALSIAENRAANMLITDDSGNAMVKKGILVDAFDGHDIGNVFDADYYASIDTKNKILRAPFALNNIELHLPSDESEVITTGYSGTFTTITENKFASKGRVCGNLLLGNYMAGDLRLDPPQITWVDTQVRPDVQVNYNGVNDGWEFNTNAFKLHWNSWKTIWQGVETTNLPVLSVTTVAGLVGVRGSEAAPLISDVTKNIITSGKLPENNLRNIGVRVLDVSVVPYIEKQIITFTATGLKPGTAVQAYFDGEDVSAHCRYFTLPTGVTVNTIRNLSEGILSSQYTPSASAYGDPLIVATDGTLVGQFLIPANTFRVGNKVFKLTDASETTSAAAQLQSSGVPNIDDGSISSTRFPAIRQDALSETQNNVVSRLLLSNPSTFNPASFGDPMAQTFIIEGHPDGVFLNKVELFFKRKSSTKKFTIQIREVINGFPGNKIVPFSTKTLNASEISVSGTANTATTFTFESPVYLKNNTEYALMLLPENNTTEYEVWVSELGENLIGTNERITQQPYVGVLFIPNNNTIWTALESEDLKFKMYSRSFETTRTVILESKPIDYVTISQTGTYVLKPGDVVQVFDDTQTVLPGTIQVSENDTIAGSSTDFTDLSVGDQLRVFAPSTTTNFTGTISITGTAVTGSATTFTSDLRVGDILYQDDNITVIGKVASIQSDTALTLEASGSGTTLNYRARALLGTVKDIISDTSLVLENDAVNITGTGLTFYKDDTTATGYVTKVYGTTAEIFITSGSLATNDTFTRGASTFTFDSIDNKQATALSPNLGILSLNPSTQVKLSYTLLDTSSTYYPGLGAYITVNNNDTVELPKEFTIYSHSNTTGNIPTLKIKAELSTNNSLLTPVLDTRKISVLTLANDIAASGSSDAVYVTRTVTLDGDGADDLRVFFDMIRPEQCSVIVEAKMQNVEDDRPFADVDWVTLNEQAPVVYNGNIYQEYSYSVSAPSSFAKFAVKITMNSTDKSKTPLIKNLRAVAVI
jgi:hypothetical protein